MSTLAGSVFLPSDSVAAFLTEAEAVSGHSAWCTFSDGYSRSPRRVQSALTLDGLGVRCSKCTVVGVNVADGTKVVLTPPGFAKDVRVPVHCPSSSHTLRSMSQNARRHYRDQFRMGLPLYPPMATWNLGP